MCQYHESGWDQPSSFEECRDYIDAAGKLGEIEKGIKQLISIIYGEEEINLGKLDDALASICDYCDVELPATLPSVRRSRSELFEMAAGMYNKTGTI
jgi:hypothetical protein